MKHHTFSSPTKGNVLWLLAQFLKLSNAIREIHDLLNPETGTNHLAPQKGPREYAWHHDLKPENILYFERAAPKAGSFKIADFGSGKVHTYRSGSGSHNTRSPNGTLTYEPPEFERDGVTSRPYDIWSMGCVFIEMFIWAIYGYDSVKSFGEKRVGTRRPGHVGTDDAFWQIDNDGNIQRRQSVDKWLNDLGVELKRRNLQSFQEALVLVDRMLDTNKQDRIKALNLSNTIWRIYSQAKVDLELYNDDSRVDQIDLGQSHRQTLSLSTQEPDREVPQLESPVFVSRPENHGSQNPATFLTGHHLTASPQTMAARLRRRESPLSDTTP